jgi:hypothetical protein
MDAISMLQAAVALFAIAAAGGLVMAGIRLLGRHNPPAWLSMLHGLLAAVLGASFLFGVVPGAIEFARTLAARGDGDAPPAP